MAKTAEDYREAAFLNLEAAFCAHDGGHFVTSHYLSGLAVECILRAYRWRIDNAWDGRHVLQNLASEGRFFDIVSNRHSRRFTVTFNDLVRRWGNAHRFYTQQELAQHLVRVGIGGANAPKENSEFMISAAHDLVGLGRGKW